MELTKFEKIFTSNKPIIGMIHLPPLPGYPTHPGMDKVIEKVKKDLNSLEKAGFSGALVENDNDQPHQIGVSGTIKEAFKQVMYALKKLTRIPLGMEVIYDMLATVEVAHEVKAQFIRLDVFVDNVETRWGKINAEAIKIVNLIQKLKANNLVLLTDIQVKHARMLDKKTLAQSAKEAIKSGSDGLIVTGNWTGNPPSLENCRIVKKVAGEIPVLVGSGLNIENAKSLLKITDGAIVGTSIKSGEYINYQKARNLLKTITEGL